MEDLKKVADWEAMLRYAANGINVTNYREYLSRCQDTMQPYWTQLCLPLLAYALAKNQRIDAARIVLESVQEPLRRALTDDRLLSESNVPDIEEDPSELDS